MKKKAYSILCSLLAAVFYALNIPLSKLLLKEVPSTLLASLLYFGAGIGIGGLYLFRYKKEEASMRLSKGDGLYVLGMVLLDIAAPILLMFGLKSTASANASLISNFEIVATTIFAMLLFREKVSAKMWIAVLLITASTAILSFEEGGLSFTAGSLPVLGATICWGLENNCTRSISHKSTYQIVTIKGLCSGAGSLLVSVLLGEGGTDWHFVLFALILGFVSYGLSIFLYIRAQADLGAAKTSAFYAAAPFVGSFLAFVVLKEKLSVNYLPALAIMLLGTAIVTAEALRTEHL